MFRNALLKLKNVVIPSQPKIHVAATVPTTEHIKDHFRNHKIVYYRDKKIDPVTMDDLLRYEKMSLRQLNKELAHLGILLDIRNSLITNNSHMQKNELY
uniref:Uncharacterized protein n=1 Tax=viral metagenome TaxID=1070528 RepID=A0A6C0CJU4_9ZZZZ